MRIYKYIVCILFALSSGVAQAADMSFATLPSARMAAAPAANRPDAQMTSTSSFLAPQTVQIASYNGGTASMRATRQMSSYTPLTASSLSRKQTKSANFATAGMGGTVQSSALSISRSNFENNTTDNSLNADLPSAPRRVGRGGPDFPEDPPGMDTPVGDIPWILCGLLLGLYLILCKKRKKVQ